MLTTPGSTPSARAPLDKSIEQFILIAPALLFFPWWRTSMRTATRPRVTGDSTAYRLAYGPRNPIPHIDLFLRPCILLPLLTVFHPTGVAFGGAGRCRRPHGTIRHYKRGDIIVSLAASRRICMIALCCVPLIVLVEGISGSADLALRKEHRRNPSSDASPCGIPINLLFACFQPDSHLGPRRIPHVQVITAPAIGL